VKRLVQPELLDTLPPGDSRAIRSRRDLRRINWWMGNPAIMARALQDHLPKPSSQITELGAGDGDFLLRVAQKIQVGQASSLSSSAPQLATLLDLQKNISPETLTAFARFGWRAEAIVANAFDWSPATSADEAVVANLFLHHFEDERLAELLRKISQNAKLFVAIEPRRSARPSVAGKLLRLIGCNDVTRHDAVVSIRAGFDGEEISALWPDRKNWQLTERRAGLFSHLFIARRRE
jgi:hypothetical protein